MSTVLLCKLTMNAKSRLFALYIRRPHPIHRSKLENVTVKRIFNTYPTWSKISKVSHRREHAYGGNTRYCALLVLCHIALKVPCFIAMVNIQSVLKNSFISDKKSWNTSVRWGFPYTVSNETVTLLLEQSVSSTRWRSPLWALSSRSMPWEYHDKRVIFFNHKQSQASS